MALLLATDATSSWLAQLCEGEAYDGTAEERAYVEELRADDAFGDLPRSDDGPGLDVSSLVEGLEGPASASDLLLLADRWRPEDESPAQKVARLQGLDRVQALVVAERNRVLVELAGDESTGQLLAEMHVEHEVALARRTSRYSAGRAIETARALATVFPGFASALRAGEVSEAHCSVLVERVRVVSDPEVLAEVERRALPKARRMTPGALGKELAAIIADVDPDAASRVRRAREARRVWTRPLDDGLSFLGLVHDTATIDAIKDAVTADAYALRAEARAASEGGGEADADPEWGDASLDALRADAVAGRLLGRVGVDGSVTWDRSAATVVVEVVMTLDDLQVAQEQLEAEPSVALVDGAPVPAAVARELADAAQWWRRLVVDPVDGHLLDYGRATYLPSRLRRFVLRRDGGCRVPGCGASHRSRVQLEHATPFPEGPSSAANCGAMSTPCHHLKTAGYADLLDSRADGSGTWATAWGQRVHIPPRPVIPGRPDPDPPPRTAAAPPPTDDDPPPF